MRTQTDTLLKNANRLNKYFMNSQRIMVDRAEDKYYMTNGYLALEITPADYRKVFMSKNGYFVELQNNERLVIYPENLEKSGKTVFSNYLKAFFYPCESDCKLVHKTDILYKNARLFLTDGSFLFAVEENIDTAERLIPDAVWYYHKNHRYFFTQCGNIGVVSMAAKSDNEFEQTLERGGYVNGKVIQ